MNVDKTRYIKNPPFAASVKDKKTTEPSWEGAEKKVKDAEKWAAVLEDLLTDVVKATNELLACNLEAFRHAPVVDCSLVDSPLSQRRIIYAIKAHLKKIGWAAVTPKDVIAPSVEIDDLSKVVGNACKWVLKLKNEDSN